jgi:hypothetical protein
MDYLKRFPIIALNERPQAEAFATSLLSVKDFLARAFSPRWRFLAVNDLFNNAISHPRF